MSARINDTTIISIHQAIVHSRLAVQHLRFDNAPSHWGRSKHNNGAGTGLTLGKLTGELVGSPARQTYTSSVSSKLGKVSVAIKFEAFQNPNQKRNLIHLQNKKQFQIFHIIS